MSDNEYSGLDAARRARCRAEQELEESIADRPEVKEVAKSAVNLRKENHLLNLLIDAMSATKRRAS